MQGLRAWVRWGWLAGCVLPGLVWAADPQIASFVDDVDPVPAGGSYSYTVRIDNNAVDAAVNTRLRVSVPAGAVFLSAAPSSQNCVATTPTQVDCNLGTLGAMGADVRNIVVTWRANGPGGTAIAATATVFADNDVNSGNNLQSQTTTVNEGANLALAMSDAPDPVVGGANVNYILTASNAGPSSAGDLVLTNNLPPSTVYVLASGSGWSCTHSAGTVTCTRAGPHASGAAIPTISILARVNTASGTVTNSATLAPALGAPADPDNSDNTATADTSVLPGADLLIQQKSVISATPAVASSNVSFRIQPRNAGPGTATSVSVSDPLPAGWTFVSAGGLNWSCGASGQNVTCTRASLPAGSADDIDIVATAPGNAAVGPAGTSYTNTASISSSTADPNGGNNSGSVSVTVLADGADLRIDKFKTPDPVALGSNLTSSITVTNNGPRIATGSVRVVEVLTGETYVSASGAGWSCLPSGNVVVCNHGNGAGLAVNGAMSTLSIVTTADVAGTVTNTACTGSSVPAGVVGHSPSPPLEGDPNPGNDCATSNATATTVQPDLAISKTTSTPSGGDKIVSTSESSVTYTLVVTNASGSAQGATGVRISDTVPGYIGGRTTINPLVPVVSGGSTASFSCSTAGAAITCNQTGGTLAQGETVTLPITMNRPLLEGSHTNNAYVSNSAQGDPNAGNNSASDTVVIEAIADVEMTGHSVTPGSVRAGETATYVLSFRNNGPSQAQAVALSDNLSFAPGDAGLTVVSLASSKAGSTCSIGAGAQLTPASSSFSCAMGAMADNEAQTVTLVVRPNYQAGNPARSVGSSASLTTTSVENPAGGNNGNNSQSATLGITAAAIDLLVNTTDAVDPVAFVIGGTFIDYRVRITNNGPSYGTGVRITESVTPPAGRRIRFVCDTATLGNASCNASSLCSATSITSGSGTALPSFNCAVPSGDAITGPAQGELAVGQSKDIFLRFEVLDVPAATGDVYNASSTVSANEPDGFAPNDTEAEATTTRQRIDMRVSKVASQPSVTLRQPFNWVVTVLNNGPGNSLQTDLTDTLPAGTEVLGPVSWTRTLQPGSGTCSLTGATISCALGQLDGGGGATITIPVRMNSVPGGGTASNSAIVDTDPLKTGAIDTPGGNNTGTGTITVTRSSISGTVFEDRDRAGPNAGTPQPAGSEPRLAGVGIRLTGNDAYGNPVDLSTLSDASGNFSFDALAPSHASGYTLTQTQPATHVNGPVDPPTAGGAQPSAGGSYTRGGAGGDSAYAGIVLAPATAAINYHFPELRRPSLSGFVYIDQNGNNQRDAATDPAIIGATLRLLDAATLALLATATTDASGAYGFTQLDPLRPYLLEQPLPATPGGLANASAQAGLIGGVACTSGCTVQADTPTAGTDRIAAIDLVAGLDGTLFNFGERQVTSISGTVFIDRNRNDAMDAQPGDGRLQGVTLRLVQGADCSSGTLLQTALTDANGDYAFSSIVAGGSYRICQTQPAGHGQGVLIPGVGASAAGSDVILISNLAAAGSAGNLFGERLASIAGSVYADSSPGTPAQTNNGIRDAGETGIATVTVTLSGRDVTGVAISRSVTTDASGQFNFDGLLASDGSGYTLSEGSIPVVAGSYNDGLETVGSAGGSAAINDVIGGIMLPAGVQAGGYLFGELPIAPISGTVYLDRNRNGVLDGAPADTPLGGVSLSVHSGSACAGAPLASTVTDTSGNYVFSGLSVGLTYTLCQTQPAAWADGGVNPGTQGSSSAANSITITALPAAGSAGNHFAERAASLAGSVYLDANHDGQRQGGETGFAGITIQLSGNDVGGQALSRSAATDASGGFRFDDLPAAGPGGFALTQPGAQPASGGETTLNGRTTAGTLGGSPLGAASSLNSTPSRIDAIVLPAGADSINHRFGEILPVAVRGVVFVDINNNGTQDALADAGLSGVSVVLSGTDDAGATVSRTASTASDGSFAFDNLRPGTYSLTEPAQPPATSNGLTVPGSSGGVATPVGTLPSAITGIVLTTPGVRSLDNRFAEIANSSAISGRIWLDADNDGSIGVAESGIAGQTVQLSGTDAGGAAVSRSVQTDGDGRYSFDALPPGIYNLLQAQQPAGTLGGRTLAGTGGGTPTVPGSTPSRIDGITLALGQTAGNNLFAEIPPARIGGRVFADNNDNGLVDLGEGGLAGVSIQLTGTDDLNQGVSRVLTSDADGQFSFPDLRPGNYVLTEPAQPVGTTNGRTTAGSLGGTASAPSVTPSVISGIVLPVGAQAAGNLFGELADSPDLRVAKTHLGTVFTVSKAATYRLSVRNAGTRATLGSYTVEDRLPPGLALAATPSGAGWTCVGAIGAGSFSCSSSSVLAAGAVAAQISAIVSVGEAAAAASPVHNAVLVDGGGEIEARRPSAAQRDAFLNRPDSLPVCTPAIEHEVCRDPAPVQRAAALSGTVWTDSGSMPRVLDAGDRRMPGWRVEVIEVGSGAVAASATTGSDGRYRIADLVPGIEYGVRFRDPASQVVFGYPVNGETSPGSSGASCVPGGQAAPGGPTASSCVGSGASPQLSVVLAPGAELTQQSLPIDPSGVVYDSGTRTPVAGAVVTLAPEGSCPGWNPTTGLVSGALGGYALNGPAVSMTVGADGFYQFLFAPSAPASCTWALSVIPPAGYAIPSAAIPPEAGPLNPTGGPGSTFAVQPQASAPTGPVGPDTVYHLRLVGGSAGANIIHNHIPADPALPGSISLAKVGDKAQAEIGDSVRYAVTVTLQTGSRPRQTTVLDRLPAGFTYIPGTATVNDVPIADPAGGAGPTLAFHLGSMPASDRLVLRYRLRVGVGAVQGDGTNRAQAHACGVPSGCVDAGFSPLRGSVATNAAQHRVRVGGGVFGTEACVLGKVFVDCNGNHLQDREELGIPGVRLMLSDLSFLVTDSEGKYSLCGLPPRSHAIRIDTATLPRGSRLTTSSHRNLADAGSLWLDLKSGELHRADFIEGSCSNTVLEQVKARRAQGEVRAPEVEKAGSPALRFDNKAHGLDSRRSPPQGTDGADQQVPKPRPTPPVRQGPTRDDAPVPGPDLPVNPPPPAGRPSGQTGGASQTDVEQGGSDGTA